MKALNIEATTVKSIALLSTALNTLARINGNTDAETYRKECIAFRNSLAITPCKLGFYTMPKGYQDFIDSQTVGAASDIRSRRQATTNSIIACYALDKKGSRTAAYLKEALRGKTALETITSLEWAVLKTKVNLAEKKAKETRDAAKLAASTPTATPSTPTAPTAPTAPIVGVGIDTTKINFSATFNQDTEKKAKIALETLEKYSDVSTIVCLARMALAKYETM